MQHCIYVAINIDFVYWQTVSFRSPQRYAEIDFATDDEANREEGSDGDDDDEEMRNCVKRVLSSPPPPPKILKCKYSCIMTILSMSSDYTCFVS